MNATYDIHQLPDTEIEDGARAQFQGFVYFPEHVDHDPEGAILYKQELDEDNNLVDTDEPVLLSFEVNVYMPTDESTRETTMQEYADDYQSGFWTSVAAGHRAA